MPWKFSLKYPRRGFFQDADEQEGSVIFEDPSPVFYFRLTFL